MGVAGKGNGKVLKSTASDNVFLNFADHGGGEIVEMPNGPYLHAKDLVTALEKMHTTNMYRKLVFYMEACNGGSMFANLLPKDINIFATTAASPSEPSWGFYCPPQDKVNGKSIGSCLGDEFSIKWMEDSDVANFMSETVGQQITKVTGLVKKSHVQQFGDMSKIGKEVIGAFEGAEASSMGIPMALNTSWAQSDHDSDSAVNSRDIEVHLAYYKLKNAETIQQRRDAETNLAALLF